MFAGDDVSHCTAQAWTERSRAHGWRPGGGGGGGVTYLWEVIPSHQDTVGGPLQYLPHTVVEAQRSPVQRAVDLTLVQPRPAVRETHKGEPVGNHLDATRNMRDVLRVRVARP